jgi:hypothetical protein
MFKLCYHEFDSFTPGARCRAPGCQGVQSLTELMSMALVVKAGDLGVSHTGKLNEIEVMELRNKKADWDLMLEKQWAAGPGF